MLVPSVLDLSLRGELQVNRETAVPLPAGQELIVLYIVGAEVAHQLPGRDLSEPEGHDAVGLLAGLHAGRQGLPGHQLLDERLDALARVARETDHVLLLLPAIEER